MRKWMQDKLKRRKKSEEAAASGPAPLQPAYFEAAPETSPRVHRDVQVPEEEAAEAEPESKQEPAAPLESRESSGTSGAPSVPARSATPGIAAAGRDRIAATVARAADRRAGRSSAGGKRADGADR